MIGSRPPINSYKSQTCSELSKHHFDSLLTTHLDVINSTFLDLKMMSELILNPNNLHHFPGSCPSFELVLEGSLPLDYFFPLSGILKTGKHNLIEAWLPSLNHKCIYGCNLYNRCLFFLLFLAVPTIMRDGYLQVIPTELFEPLETGTVLCLVDSCRFRFLGLMYVISNRHRSSHSSQPQPYSYLCW